MPKQPITKRSAGRPKATIDWTQVGKMLEAGATGEGVAATFGVSVDTLYNRCKSDLNVDFSAYKQQKLARGDELLRTKQFQVAMSGDRTMLVWLGKNRLKQTDRSEISNKLAEEDMQTIISTMAKTARLYRSVHGHDPTESDYDEWGAVLVASGVKFDRDVVMAKVRAELGVVDVPGTM